MKVYVFRIPRRGALGALGQPWVILDQADEIRSTHPTHAEAIAAAQKLARGEAS